ncbi:MAG: sensor histidine kinase [Lachnospirales bacterium]
MKDIRIFFPKKFFSYNLRTKVFLLFLVTVLALSFCYSKIVLSVVEKNFIKERETLYLNQTNTISSLMSSERYITRYHEGDTDAITNMNKMLDSKAKEGSFRVLVFDYDGYCIADTNQISDGRYYNFAELNLALNGEDNANVKKSSQIIYSAVSIVNDNFDIRGAILVVDDVSDLFTFLEELQGENFLIVVFLVALALLVASAVSSWFVRPIKNMLRVIEDMSDGHLDKRFKVNSSDEFSELGIAFNSMAEKIEAMERTKDQFVSNVSHELKTPLSAIKVLGESTLHMENMDKETYDEFLGDIISEVDRMTEIINDLLVLVRLDHADVKVDFQKVQVDVFLENVIKSLKALADRKEIEIISNLETTVEIEIDRLKMFSAVSNVIENAIKYTPVGGNIEIYATCDNQFVYISVKDTGVGIEEAELDNIFKRFYRVDDSRNRETGGTGLGLSIAHSAILLHNGSIRVSSKIGEGTVFLIRLPIKVTTNSEV